MTETTELTIIIVNWNTRDLLRESLAALAASVLPKHTETIVVDNASADGSVEMLRAEYPAVDVIVNEHNVGYARANNQALRRARGQHVLLLNSDTRVSPSAVAVLLRFMDAHPHVGACAPRLVMADGVPQPFAYGGDPTLTYLLRRAVVRWSLRRGLHDWASPRAQEIDWVSGACLLVRRDAINAIGLLDEGMFMYFEDVDWCLRMRRSGWRIAVQPDAVVTHIGGQRLGQNPMARGHYDHSLRAFYAKHYGRLARILMEAGLWLYRLTSPHEDG